MSNCKDCRFYDKVGWCFQQGTHANAYDRVCGKFLI